MNAYMTTTCASCGQNLYLEIQKVEVRWSCPACGAAHEPLVPKRRDFAQAG